MIKVHRYLYFGLYAEELVSANGLVCHVERLSDVGIVVVRMWTLNLQNFSFQTADQQTVVFLCRHTQILMPSHSNNEDQQARVELAGQRSYSHGTELF